MMSNPLRIFLDVCCLNRPFDDRRQSRIALEAQAVLEILNHCQNGTHKLITSSSLQAEIAQTPNLERQTNVMILLAIAKIKVLHSPALEKRIHEIQQMGFTPYDAAHLASAEKGKADIFLSTDDRLLKKAQKNANLIQVSVNNPVQWLIENH